MRTTDSRIIADVSAGKLSYAKKVVITLKSGSTVTLTDRDFWQNGVTVETASSQQSSFDVGSAVIGVMTVCINDAERKYRDTDFDGARAEYYVVCTDYDVEIPVFAGTVIDTPEEVTSIITIKCYDDMYKFDKPYDTKLSFPATAEQVVRDCCVKCLGSDVLEGSFYRSTVNVPKKPDSDTVTYRQILSWICEMTGNYAIMAVGKLRVSWYSASSPYSIGSKKSTKIGKQSRTITGVSVTESGLDVWPDGSVRTGHTYDFGATDCVVKISNNELIRPGYGNAIGTALYNRLKGFTYRAFNIEAFSNPLLEPGDAIEFEDIDGESYVSFITNMTLQMGSGCTLSCGANDNSSTQYTKLEKAMGMAESSKAEAESAKKEAEDAMESAEEAMESAEAAKTEAEQAREDARLAALTAESAAKTATNAIDFVPGTGLILGDKRSGAFQGATAVLSAGGLELIGVNDKSIAKYGYTSRIGAEDGSRFEIDENALAAFDENGSKYFYVTSEGMNFGTVGGWSIEDGGISSSYDQIVQSIGQIVVKQRNEIALNGSPESDLESAISVSKQTYNSTDGGKTYSRTEEEKLLNMDYSGSLECQTLRAYYGVHCYDNQYHEPIGSIDTAARRVSMISAPSKNTITVSGRFGASSFSSVTFTGTSSDERLKENIKDSEVDAIAEIMKIRHRSFDWKVDGSHNDVGYIAQELEKVNPHMVIVPPEPKDDETAYYGVDTFYMLGLATKAIQELERKVKSLEDKISELERRM